MVRPVGAPGGLRILSFPATLKIVTPLHIGTGHALRNGFDYVVDRTTGEVQIIDVDRALADLTDEEIAKARDGRIASALGQARRESCLITSYRLRREGDLDELRPTMRDPLSGKAMVPGSSLKGAMRTALLGSIVAPEGSAHPTQRPAIEALAAVAPTALGREATPQNRDLMRAVRISDFILERGQTDLFDVAVERLRPRPGEASGIPMWVEAIAPGAILHGTISIEQETPLRRAADPPAARAFGGILVATLRKRAAAIARYERAAHDQAGATAHPLFALIEAAESEGPTYVNVGWGSGWHAKTIYPEYTAIDATAAQQVAQAGWAEQLRRRRMPPDTPIPRPYPSSRRIARRSDQSYPMGWVTVRTEHRVLYPRAP